MTLGNRTGATISESVSLSRWGGTDPDQCNRAVKKTLQRWWFCGRIDDYWTNGRDAEEASDDAVMGAGFPGGKTEEMGLIWITRPMGGKQTTPAMSSARQGLLLCNNVWFVSCLYWADSSFVQNRRSRQAGGALSYRFRTWTSLSCCSKYTAIDQWQHQFSASVLEHKKYHSNTIISKPWIFLENANHRLREYYESRKRNRDIIHKVIDLMGGVISKRPWEWLSWLGAQGRLLSVQTHGKEEEPKLNTDQAERIQAGRRRGWWDAGRVLLTPETCVMANECCDTAAGTQFYTHS